MNWDAMGAIAEALGALAVLLTLLYLAIQMRQTNSSSRFSASKEIWNQFNDLNKLVTTDSTLRQVLSKEGELSADEQEQVYNFAMMFCNVWGSVQLAYNTGQIEADFYAAGAKDVQVEIDRWPNFKAAIETWLDNYPEFKDYDIFLPMEAS